MTIARIQQLMTLAMSASTLGWVVWCISQGQQSWAPWAFLVLVAHAPVLAVETCWAAIAARRPIARRPLGAVEGLEQAVQPYPGWMTWVQSWAKEVLHGMRVFGWQQPWRHAAEPDHLPPPAPATTDANTTGRRGVLLVHGFVCNRGFWNRWMRQLRRAGVPHVAVTLESPFADIAEQARGIAEAARLLQERTGLAPLLVGHSMGGLVIRSWLASLPTDQALSHEVITIGSPHHGTALAQFAQSEAALQMQLLSPFLQDLAARETPQRRARFTCYWSVCDNIVFPASTATLPGARNLHLPGHPHVGLSQAPEILRDVLGRCGAAGA